MEFILVWKIRISIIFVQMQVQVPDVHLQDRQLQYWGFINNTKYNKCKTWMHYVIPCVTVTWFIAVIRLVNVVMTQHNAMKDKACSDASPSICHMSKSSALVAQRRRMREGRKDNATLEINGTRLLMNDRANCENGLLLFGWDKYSDKWSALIIPSVFVPERRRRRSTRDAFSEWDKLIKSDFPAPRSLITQRQLRGAGGTWCIWC